MSTHVFPEYQQAYRLQCAFYTLHQYYAQATRGPGLGLLRDLAAVFKTSRPISHLYPLNPTELAQEMPGAKAARRALWVDTLRPRLTPALLRLVGRTNVTRWHLAHPAQYTLEMRDKALAVLEAAVEYWDAVYPPQ